jgi:hypothetical protein
MFRSIFTTIFRGLVAQDINAVTNLNSVDVRSLCVVEYAAVCHYHRFVCVSGAADRV